jgi:hypothetical protein
MMPNNIIWIKLVTTDSYPLYLYHLGLGHSSYLKDGREKL